MRKPKKKPAFPLGARRCRPNGREGEKRREGGAEGERGGRQRKSSLANDNKEPGNGGVDSDLGQEAQRQRRPSHRSFPSLPRSLSSPPLLLFSSLVSPFPIPPCLPSQRFARPYMCLTPVNQWHVALMGTRPHPPPPTNRLFSAFSLVQLISGFNLLKEDEFEDGLCEMLQLFFYY